MSKLILKKKFKKISIQPQTKTQWVSVTLFLQPCLPPGGRKLLFLGSIFFNSLRGGGGQRLSYIFSSIDTCFLRGSPASAEKGKRSKLKNPKGLPRAAVSCNPGTGPSPSAWPHLLHLHLHPHPHSCPPSKKSLALLRNKSLVIVTAY